MRHSQPTLPCPPPPPRAGPSSPSSGLSSLLGFMRSLAMRGRSLLLSQDVDTIQDVPQLSRALRRADRLLEEVDEEVGGGVLTEWCLIVMMMGG